MKTQEQITNEDCIKAGMVVLESLTSKGFSFEQQLFLTCCMLGILQASHTNLEIYLELEKQKRKQAQNEVEALFGLGS